MGCLSTQKVKIIITHDDRVLVTILDSVALGVLQMRQGSFSYLYMPVQSIYSTDMLFRNDYGFAYAYEYTYKDCEYIIYIRTMNTEHAQLEDVLRHIMSL